MSNNRKSYIESINVKEWSLDNIEDEELEFTFTDIKKERDFTLDELVFMQGHLGYVQEKFEEMLRNGLYVNGSKEVTIRKINTLKEINEKIRKLFDTY